MDDLISRQKAIDTLADMQCKSDGDGYVWIIRSDAWARIDALPSTEPEIIRCEDCRWWERESICEGHCLEIDLHHVDEDHYCSFAERRTDE